MSLAPQVKELGDKVELIVSDNCSPDDTPQVVEEAQKWCPIRYNRNPENLGAARNGDKLVYELARGEFLWVIGDDDIVRPDGVVRIVNVLETHPDVDYVFVNTSPRLSAARHAFARPVTGADFPDLLPAKGKSLEDRAVDRWEDLVDPKVDEIFLGSLMCAVHRLSRMKQYRFELGPEKEPFSMLEYSYPVSQAYTMVGRKAYYIGYPCTIAFWGDQKWMRYRPLLVLVRLQELLDLYLRVGVPVSNVEKCRSYLLDHSTRYLKEMLLDKQTPGRRYFSLGRFIWRNRRHPFRLGSKFGKVWFGLPEWPDVKNAMSDLLPLWRRRFGRLVRDPLGLCRSAIRRLSSRAAEPR